MKIVIFGFTAGASWGNGRATLWRGLCRALADRGHCVVFFERVQPSHAANRHYFKTHGSARRLYESWSEVRGLAGRELADADVGLVTSRCSDGLSATELLQETGVPLRVFYDLDTPLTLGAMQRGQAVNYIGPRGLIDFDLVLSSTGGDALQQLRRRLGARMVVPLYGCVDPAVHRPVLPEKRFAGDLSYLGTYAADRHETLETLLIEPARRLPGQRFQIGGARYPADFPWVPNIHFVKHLKPAQHPAFFCSSRLTLNITDPVLKAVGFCPSSRLFEAAACGVPIVSDGWKGLDRFFQPGSEILVAERSVEAIAALEMSDVALRRIARQALERVRNEHTAMHRVLEMEFAFESALARREPAVQAATA